MSRSTPPMIWSTPRAGNQRSDGKAWAYMPYSSLSHHRWRTQNPSPSFNPRDYRIPAPSASNPENSEAYKAQVDHVLEVSANLTDEDKMMAEFFDNKIVSVGMVLDPRSGAASSFADGISCGWIG